MVFAAYRAMRVMREKQKRSFVTMNVPARQKPSFRQFRAADIIAAAKIKDGLRTTEEQKIKIYVSGRKFYTDLALLINYPDTLLGSSDRRRHFSKQLGCFFFDRNRKAFKAILNWYKTGKLLCPKSMNVQEFERELEFFRINARNHTKVTVAEVLIQKVRPNKNWPRWQRNIYHTVAEPGDDVKSKLWAAMDTLFILCSIILFIAETEPYFKAKINTLSIWHGIFFWGDAICVTFFLFDFLLRALVWPNKLAFFKSLLNWLDFLAILPFFVTIVTTHLTGADGHDHVISDPDLGPNRATKGSFVALKVLRLMRIIRLLKLARHCEQLVLIVSVLKKSGNEMCILALLWVLSSVTFGSIIYYAESGDPDTDITSITVSCWWTVVTMSTVGYGDMIPKTVVGKFLGSVVVLLSMVFMAMPMTLIVGKFSAAYEDIQPVVKVCYASSEEDEGVTREKLSEPDGENVEGFKSVVDHKIQHCQAQSMTVKEPQ